MVPLESLRTVSYSHSIVTGRIFSRFDLCSKIRILRFQNNAFLRFLEIRCQKTQKELSKFQNDYQ